MGGQRTYSSGDARPYANWDWVPGLAAQRARQARSTIPTVVIIVPLFAWHDNFCNGLDELPLSRHKFTLTDLRLTTVRVGRCYHREPAGLPRQKRAGASCPHYIEVRRARISQPTVHPQPVEPAQGEM
jgi:hypothetical protein